jgi:hypothetical protein
LKVYLLNRFGVDVFRHLGAIDEKSSDHRDLE